jgi:uncharacterized protein
MRRMNIPNLSPLEHADAALVQRAFIAKVYAWMALALAITGVMAVATAANIEQFLPILAGPGLMIVLFAQLGIVLGLSFAINKISASIATGLFLLYAIITGFTLSTLFFVYTAESIATTFFVTAGTFAVVSGYGYVTKSDLTRWGSLLLMGLIGILIASLVNFFLQSEALMWVTTYAGVIIFVGLIAYDTQRLKNMALGLGEDGEVQRKGAVIGALALYLDFINLFIRLLRILGRRR